MPWKKMKLRDAEVLARVDSAGQPVASAGRVEVRYGPRSPKAYRASVGNLTPVPGAAILPDEHCVDVAEDAAPGGASGARAGATATAKGSARARGAKSAAAAGPAPADAVIVWADGACSGNPGPAGLGMVVIDGADVVERSEYLGEATNNVAELTAVRRALEAVADPARAVVIHTDSQYAIGVLSLGWKAKANQALIAELRAMLAARPGVRFVHVRGHAGIPLNERADELARAAVSSRRTTEKRFERATSVTKPERSTAKITGPNA